MNTFDPCCGFRRCVGAYLRLVAAIRLIICFSVPLTDRFTEDVFDLSVETAQLVFGPSVQLVQELRREAQEK